ncbi:hypothetical protein [Paraburkholderia sp. CNPSo 3281]|uniref:hypothetical protein n=1 Tax=Paraburkholderia sp. CNPSo 3281 TaxID=2940933 RepID=UPI0035CCEDFA
MAQTATLEDVATLLWNARADVTFEAADVRLHGDERGRDCAFTSLAATGPALEDTVAPASAEENAKTPDAATLEKNRLF